MILTKYMKEVKYKWTQILCGVEAMERLVKIIRSKH